MRPTARRLPEPAPTAGRPGRRAEATPRTVSLNRFIQSGGRRSMRGRYYLALLLLVVLALLPATAGSAPSRVPQNVLVIGRIIGDVVSLDPAEAFELTSTWIDEHPSHTLLHLTP